MRDEEIKCLAFHDHTPCPDGYIQWHAWAKLMGRTHRQIKCTACGRYSIWIPKRKKNKEAADPTLKSG